jgi:hypothetical protein
MLYGFVILGCTPQMAINSGEHDGKQWILVHPACRPTHMPFNEQHFLLGIKKVEDVSFG